MEPLKGPEELVATSACSRCGETVPLAQLQRCPWCFRDFCPSCRFARGVTGFCSRGCGEAMFHGGDEEEGGEED